MSDTLGIALSRTQIVLTTEVIDAAADTPAFGALHV